MLLYFLKFLYICKFLEIYDRNKESKLGYNSCFLFIMLTIKRHWNICFSFTLYNKFVKKQQKMYFKNAEKKML